MNLSDTECKELRDILRKEIYRIENAINFGKAVDPNIDRLRKERQMFLVAIMGKLHTKPKQIVYDDD